MTVTPTPAGRAPDGKDAVWIDLAAGDLTARILTFGAILADFRVDGRPIVLGSDRLDDFVGPLKHAGAIVGRVANRIAGASFEWRGGTLRLDANDGENILHGGAEGTGRLTWDLADATPTSCRLCLSLPDGHMGFPGEMSVTATYALDEGGLTVRVEAVAGDDTVSNFAHHPFFDLTGTGDGRRQVVQVLADRYLPVTDDTLPTGEIAPVDGTPFDLRDGRTLDEDTVYDNNWCLSDSRTAMRDVCRIEADGLQLTLSTTEPGLQLFDGHKFDGAPGHDGAVYGPYAGYAVEAQHWPDAPNHPDFPSIRRAAGETDRMEVRYAVSRI